MDPKDNSLRQRSICFNSLFQLLSHHETNYAVFAVSRIKVISQIIGLKKTKEELIPELKKFMTKTQLYQEISQLVLQAISQIQGKELKKSQ